MSCCWCRPLTPAKFGESSIHGTINLCIPSYAATREVQTGDVAQVRGQSQLPTSSPSSHSQVDTRNNSLQCSGAQEKSRQVSELASGFHRVSDPPRTPNLCNLTFCCCNLARHGRGRRDHGHHDACASLQTLYCAGA